MMLNLEIIEKSSKTLDGAALAAYGRRWLPALVAELREAREELAAVNEAVSKFYAPSLDYMQPEIRRLRAETERLRAFVPSPELMQRLAHLDEDYARHVDEAPPDDEYYSYAELPQAWRIEEAQE